MNRQGLIALGVLILIATGGALALKSIDQNKGESLLAIPVKEPLPSAEDAAAILPAPRVEDTTLPPTFDAPPPQDCPPSSEVYLTLPPRPMKGPARC